MADQKSIYDDFSDFMKFFNKINLVEDFKNIDSSETAIIIEPIKLEESISNKSSRPKCGICKVKINAVDIIISSCKCNGKYCVKHRMPELHNCEKITEIAKEQKKDLENKLVKVTGCKLSTI